MSMYGTYEDTSEFVSLGLVEMKLKYQIAQNMSSVKLDNVYVGSWRVNNRVTRG